MGVNPSRWVSQHRRDELRSLAARSHQVVLLAAITGALTGLVVAAFDRLVVNVMFDRVLTWPPLLIGVLPGIGLLVSYCIRRLGARTSPSTADEYLRSFHQPDHHLGWEPFAVRMFAAIATLGTGNPMGLEGPSLYAGATLGSALQRRYPRAFRGTDRRLLLVAGAAAGVAAIFKAPATGAVFALEVPYQGDLARRMLLPALVASATGYLAFVAVNGTATLFQIEAMGSIAFRDLGGAIALGIVAGLGARVFAWMVRTAKQLNGSRHPLLVTIAAGLVVGGAFAVGRVLTGQSFVVGSGYRVLDWAEAPTHALWLLVVVLLLRSVATSAVVAGGGVGGLFIPLVVGGALTGAIVGHVIDKPNTNLFIVIGIAAFLGAGYRVPLAAVMFVAETTGRPSFIVPGLLAAVAAELIMGNSSVTLYQRSAEQEPAAGDPTG